MRPGSSKFVWRAVWALLLLGPALPLSAQYRLEQAQPAMGTEFRILLYATDSVAGRAAITAGFARIDSLELSMSDYRADSELNRLTRRPARRRHPVSVDLWRVLQLSREVARRSRGAFDPTVGPLSKLWRRAFRRGEFPGRRRLRAARTRVRWRWLRIGPDTTVALRRAGMQLDLGGIAKGYALDAVARHLRAAGYSSFLLDGGGDLLLGDPPPNSGGWRIATEGAEGRLLSTASRTAIATSGDTYRYLEWRGRRYGHLIDPRTGLGIADVVPVTVVGPTAALADALASAASVLRGRARRRLLRRYPNYRLRSVVGNTANFGRLNFSEFSLNVVSALDTKAGGT